MGVGRCPVVPLPDRQPPEALRRLARHFMADRVLPAALVDPDLLTTVFIPIGLGARELFAGYTDEDFTKVTVFAVHGEDATTGRYINGYPMFAECRVWLLADFNAALEMAKRALAAQGRSLEAQLNV